MKRLIVTMFVIGVMFTLSSPSVSAQGLSGGVKCGLNAANLHGDDMPEGWISRKGLCAGGFITFSINNMFAIQPEFLYTQKGAKNIELGPVGIWKQTVNLDYLEVPVLVKLLLPTPGIIKPNLFIGPSIGFKLNAKEKVEYAGLSVEDNIEWVKDTDFGLVFGGGVDFEHVTAKITFDARYNLGWTTIDDSEPEEDIKNGVISLMVGYSF